MTGDITVTLPDDSTRPYPKGTTPAEVAASIGRRLAKDAIAAVVDGQVVDLEHPLDHDARVAIVTPATPPAGVGLYGLSPGAPTDQAIEDNWPVIGDTGALGTQTVPYTGLSAGADLSTGQSIVASGRRITWLSFWTVSGPVASGPGRHQAFVTDPWGNAIELHQRA